VHRQTSFEDPEVRRNFLMGMFNLASLLAPQVARQIDLSGRTRLLDLGGGPGTYAIHFCRRNKALRAVVFDRPTTRPFAREIIARHGLEARIDFQAGDYRSDALKGPYDVVWLSHILHAEGPETCRQLLHKVHDALASGGLILVHDFLLAASMDGPLFPALFSLNMLQATSEGRAYTRQQIEDMLAAAGFGQIHSISLESPNGSGIVAARK
jgi:cyclopropane fatty-acyl-phospholipid synthase-like methyltransferase